MAIFAFDEEKQGEDMPPNKVPLLEREERKLSLFAIGGAIFVIAVSIFRLWEMSTEWRVENVPALSTQLERDRVALMRDFERVQMALRTTYKAGSRPDNQPKR